MRSFPVAHPGATYATPEAVIAEGQELLATLHSLDRDNLDEQVTVDKFYPLAFGAIEYVTRDVVRTDTYPDVTSNNGALPVLDDAGNPLTLTIDTGDCALQVTVSVQVNILFDGWVGFRVDGIEYRSCLQLTGVSLTADEGGRIEFDGVHPCGAGSHLVEAVFGSTIRGSVGTSFSVVVGGAILLAHEVV